MITLREEVLKKMEYINSFIDNNLDNMSTEDRISIANNVADLESMIKKFKENM